MALIMNEKEHAENLLAGRQLGAKPSETLGYIARYYMGNGYSPAQTQGLIEDFMLKCDQSIVLFRWREMIDRQIKWAKTRKLTEINEVLITQKELDVCAGIESVRLRRLMFALIVLAKFSNIAREKDTDWTNRKDRELFAAANVSMTNRDKSLALNDLKNMGLIRFNKKVDNLSIHVNCVDHEGEPVLHITDLRNLGYQYMKHCGGDFIECKCCGLTVKRVTNNQKYCADCGVVANRESARKRRERQNFTS